MKKQIIKKLLNYSLAALTALQCMTVGITASADATGTADTFPTYKKTTAFSSGQQGTNGWYFMYEHGDTGEYIEMSGTFSGGGASVDTNFINPGYGTPAVVAWVAPYDGTVKLTTEDSTIYRSGAHENGGDVIATLKLNDTILTDDSNNKTQWTFDKNCKNGTGNQTYTVSNLHVNKGDVLYHKVDCGTNNTAAGIYWKPIVTYTECEKISASQSKYAKVDAYKNCGGVQGYDGWYYYKKDATGNYTQLKWNSSVFKDGSTTVDDNFLLPGKNAPVVVAWKAPYTGVVTLSHQDTVYRDGAPDTAGDITVTLKLNDTILKDDTNNDINWVFDKTCKNETGKTKTYTVSNLSVTKGDVIYHEVDCGTNEDGRNIYWKPIITYTEAEIIPDKTQREYQKKDAVVTGMQGYNCWYYLKKDAISGEYTKLKWDSNNKKYIESDPTVFIDDTWIKGGVDTPYVVAWKAPYSGTVNLSAFDAIVHRSEANQNGGDVFATMKLNDEVIKYEAGQKEAQWKFDNTCDHDNGAQVYEANNLHVNKGDMIYHEVYCKTTALCAGIYWKPIVKYTSYDNDDDTYIIKTITDYKNFADVVNNINSSACAKLAADIEWNVNTPQLNNFSGTIDGDGHKITLRGKALIKSAANGATIKNLFVDGAVTGTENVGAFVEKTAGTGAAITISNSANLANVTASTNNAGGLIGLVDGTDTVVMSNCYGNGKVKSVGDTANPFACTSEGATVTYTKCYYLSGGTTKGENEVVSPSAEGIKANNTKTFVILNNVMAYGYSENVGRLIIAEYTGGLLSTLISINNLEEDTLIRNEYTSGNGDAVKAFVWGGTEGMDPACDEFIVNLK